METLASNALIVVIFAVPYAALGWMARWFRGWRRQSVNEVSAAGTTVTSDQAMTGALIMFWGAAAFLTIAAFPGVIWLVDRDAVAGRAAVALAAVAVAFVVPAAVFGWFATRMWTLESDALVERRGTPRGGARTGARRSPLRVRRIPYDEIVELRARRSVLGALGIRSADDEIRLPHAVRGFDEFVSGLRARAPDAAETAAGSIWRRDGEGGATLTPGAPGTLLEPQHFSVPKMRTIAAIAFLALTFIGCFVWPWFAVVGEHKVRDSFAFIGFSLIVWLIIAALMYDESFRRSMPAELVLDRDRIRWRGFASGWQERPVDELLSASVESDIIYVRSIPGRRYPLVLSFTDGEQVTIDDMRAKHMGVSTINLGQAIRRRYFDVAHRAPVGREHALAAVAAGDAELADERPAEAIPHYQQAIAHWPNAENVARFRTIGDLQRQADEHEAAVSSYRAHLDFAPDDHLAWQGLSASFRAIDRDDLADEAAAAAEQALMRR